MEDKILQSRQPLKSLDLSSVNKRYHRILLFDPSEIYNRIESFIKPNKRQQWIPIERMFPSLDKNQCACGCGQKLSGRRTRYATDECNNFVFQVFAVITGRTGTIGNILYAIYGWNCSVCGKNELDIDIRNEKDSRSVIEIEHTLPVKHGGGGCWLGNFSLQCYLCHRVKTNKDFGWKSKVKQLEIGKQQELFK